MGLVFLTTADTELIALAGAQRQLPDGFPPVAAFNCAGWGAAEVDAHVAPRLRDGRGCVAVRLLGGRRAAPEVVDRLVALCRERSVALALWPGDRVPDPELSALSSLDADVAGQAYAYLLHGGAGNCAHFLRLLADTTCGTAYGCAPPTPLPWDGRYHPRAPDDPEGAAAWWQDYLADRSRPVVGILFYRAHWMTQNLALVDALVDALEARGCRALPVFCYSLRQTVTAPGGSPDELEPAAFAHLRDPDGTVRCEVLVSTLSFAMGEVTSDGSQVASQWSAAALERLDVCVLQAITATSSRERWATSSQGLSPVDVVMNVALPEFDGRLITVPISFKEVRDGVARYLPEPDRIDLLAGLAARFARLRRLANADKRIALVLSSYPTRNARVGNAVGLDTPASAVRLLRALADAGYDVGEAPLPEDGDTLMHDLLERGGYERQRLTARQLDAAVGRLEVAEYRSQLAASPEATARRLVDAWGDPPGDLYVHHRSLRFAGLQYGKVLVCIQPPRGFGEDPTAIYHSPELPPTHHYLAFHWWLRHAFGADAVVHLGKHGTLEWLPGKALGLSAECFPDLCLGDLPLVYPFVVNDPGEGTQAKRRAHATIVDHLIPPVGPAESYGALLAVEQLMDEYFQSQALDPERLPLIRERLWQAVRQAHLDQDLEVTEVPDDFDHFLQRVDGYVCEIKDAQVRRGLHVLGAPPEADALVDMLVAMARLGSGGTPGLSAAVAAACGLDLDGLHADAAAPAPPLPPCLVAHAPAQVRVAGDVVEALRALERHLVAQLAAADFDPACLERLTEEVLKSRAPTVVAALAGIATRLWPALRRTSDEIDNVLRALAGRYVPAGPSGAPTRGMTHVLPTGRNFYSVDPKSLPTETSWQVGCRLAEAVVSRHLAETGDYPRCVGIVVWGTAAMRTGGDDIAEALALLGVRPVWTPENRRVAGLEVIPLEELGRPRVDVVLRVSGFFRDAFPNLVHLVDEAVQLVAALDEPEDANCLAARVRAEVARLNAAGLDPARARRRATYRIFGSRPGAYGAGVLPLLDSGAWRDEHDIAAVYTAWGAYAYGREAYGVAAEEEFRHCFSRIAVAIKNQDNREHDIFDSDDYLQYHGGMVACVRALVGRAPAAVIGDTADPQRSRVRSLAEEARRVVRARVLNPRWLEAMQRHGYKGAFEMAATVDYLFGYDATAGAVDDWVYGAVADAYVLDGQVQDFIRRSNPWALEAMAERLLEAAARGLWGDADDDRLQRLRRLVAEVDADLEGGTWRRRPTPARAEGEGTR